MFFSSLQTINQKFETIIFTSKRLLQVGDWLGNKEEMYFDSSLISVFEKAFLSLLLSINVTIHTLNELKKQLEDPAARIIITTIQKLSRAARALDLKPLATLINCRVPTSEHFHWHLPTRK